MSTRRTLAGGGSDMSALNPGQRLTKPCDGLPGRWAVWSPCGWGPGHYFLLPLDGQPVKHAVVKVVQKRDAVHPEITLIHQETP